jgi:hypothetical protein
VGVDAAIVLLLRRTSGKPADDILEPEVMKLTPAVEVKMRGDISLSGGRSGENVKFLTGPPNSAVRSTAQGRIFITNSKGQVIFDITVERVKPVRPQAGFDDKRPPTQMELNLIQMLWDTRK